MRIGGVTITFSFWFFAVILLFSLLDKEALALYFILPIAVHELGHLLAMRVCGVPVRRVSFTAMGVDIRKGGGATLGYGKEAAITLGGVAANAAAALYFYLCWFQSMRVMFLVAANAAVAIFNLLPIGDLDGGQLLRLLSDRFFTPDTARMVSKSVSCGVLALLFGVAIFLLLIRFINPTLLVACGYLAVNVITRE